MVLLSSRGTLYHGIHRADVQFVLQAFVNVSSVGLLFTRCALMILLLRNFPDTRRKPQTSGASQATFKGHKSGVTAAGRRGPAPGPVPDQHCPVWASTIPSKTYVIEPRAGASVGSNSTLHCNEYLSGTVTTKLNPHRKLCRSRLCVHLAVPVNLHMTRLVTRSLRVIRSPYLSSVKVQGGRVWQR